MDIFVSKIKTNRGIKMKNQLKLPFQKHVYMEAVKHTNGEICQSFICN